MFSDIFFDGDRHAAMEKLRVTTRSPSVALGARFGVFAGLCFFPMLFILYAAASFSWQSSEMALGQGRRVPGLSQHRPDCGVYVFAGDQHCRVDAKRINYVFIFEFDPPRSKSLCAARGTVAVRVVLNTACLPQLHVSLVFA